ncbi:NAD(P)/FAD-dependent oxidoreductase [Prauserella cavernicola]|uniref:FAD-dependent oxidoreductase n=1 Tax=Prauserella cavernicola TaxID=2800127 RepID=A0A934QXF9_9PSEU|nr:FAD-dependent oxidoreductase [Prauserella cavernicola]MBK1787309.1 FAD-dependent oxidoreductase [Prauserella cavernicola]
MSRENLVVVGASLAGLRAVEAARKAGFRGAITLVGAEEHLPYDRPPLSKSFLDDRDPEPPVFRTESVLRDDLGVELSLGTPATGLDVAGKQVRVGERCLDYDALVIATGATARTLPGSQHLAGVHTVRTLDDAVAVRKALDAGARTLVVGAGFIGSEIASGARARGLDVTVVEAQATPLVRAVGEVMGSACSRLHHDNGTDLRCGVGVQRVEGDGRVERVVLSDGSVIDAELVVVGIGATPATDWLRDSGLTLDSLDNGVVCDETLCTGAEGVYAAGDVARWHNPVFERAMRLEHWTSAAEQGALAARNALDPAAATPYRTVPYFWSDVYGSRIQFVGVPASDEVRVVEGDPDRGGRIVALYREGDRLAGALTINGQNVIMKYRGLITKATSWPDALAFAEQRRAVAT